MSAIQTYRTTDRFSLTVQEPWNDLPNLADKLNGTADGWWGHLGQASVSVVSSGVRVTNLAGGGASEGRAYLPSISAAPGRYIRATAKRVGGTATKSMSVGVIQFNDSGTVSTATGSAPSTVGGVSTLAATAVDPSTTGLIVFIRGNSLTAGQYVEADEIVVVMGNSLAAVNAATMEVERSWSDVTYAAAEVTVERDELQVGTITATLIESSLDPATVDLIRPGRRIQASGLKLTGVNTGWQLLTPATILQAQAVYDLKTKGIPDNKRSRIVVTAVDDVSLLANTPRPQGVASIDELPYVLAGSGVPWNVNGSRAGVPESDVTIVSVVEAATAVDQVAIARDTARGYAWLDRKGTLQVWDAASIPTAIAATLNEASYSDASVDFDTQRCINTVTIKLLTIDPDTGDTVETSHGPYVDAESVLKWGARTAEFTVHGIDVADLETYAAGILADAATPTVRVNSLTLPLRTSAELDAHVSLDLYDLVTVQNARAGINQDLRVVSIRHRLTAGSTRGRSRWLVDVGFAADSGVAPPQVTPSPEKPTAATLARRLRPIGEVTSMYGTAAQVWAGWKIMDGTPFNVADYPDFAAWLGPLIAAGGHPAFTSGGTIGVLPNATDRVIVGAGTKAPGSTGGAFSRVIAAANLPPHTHPLTTRDSATGFGVGAPARGTNTGTAGSANTGDGGFANTALDITPKYLAAFHIIKVK